MEDINLRVEIVKLQSDVNYMKEKIKTIERDMTDDKNSISVNAEEINRINLAILRIEKSVTAISELLERLDDNVFLQFTKDIDLKKFVAIIFVITSPVSLGAFIENIFTSPESQLERKVERLEKTADKLIEKIEGNENL